MPMFVLGSRMILVCVIWGVVLLTRRVRIRFFLTAGLDYHIWLLLLILRTGL